MRRLVLLVLVVSVPALAAAEVPSAVGTTAEVPAEGVPFVAARGFFTEMDLGAFLTVGGNDGYSNVQTYLQLGVGVDLTRRLELGLHFGLGTSSTDCFATGSATAGTCSQAPSFTAAMLDLWVGYLFPVLDRLYVSPRVLMGYASLDPTPVPNHGALTFNGAQAGVGAGIEYATSLEHLTVGADLSMRWIFGANVPALALFPRVKYTF